VIGSFIQQVLVVYRKKHNASFIRQQRRKKLPVSTPQWMILCLGIAALVGTIFIFALVYLQPGR
jgi:hypothetical protein